MTQAAAQRPRVAGCGRRAPTVAMPVVATGSGSERASEASDSASVCDDEGSAIVNDEASAIERRAEICGGWASGERAAANDQASGGPICAAIRRVNDEESAGDGCAASAIDGVTDGDAASENDGGAASASVGCEVETEGKVSVLVSGMAISAVPCLVCHCCFRGRRDLDLDLVCLFGHDLCRAFLCLFSACCCFHCPCALSLRRRFRLRRRCCRCPSRCRSRCRRSPRFHCPLSWRAGDADRSQQRTAMLLGPLVKVQRQRTVEPRV